MEERAAKISKKVQRRESNVCGLQACFFEFLVMLEKAEFLELMEAIEKHGKDEQLQKIRAELEAIPDEALDMHTFQGRRMGRGDLYWYEVSSETVNKTPEYESWREQFFKPLMLQLIKKNGREKNEP